MRVLLLCVTFSCLLSAGCVTGARKQHHYDRLVAQFRAEHNLAPDVPLSFADEALIDAEAERIAIEEAAAEREEAARRGLGVARDITTGNYASAILGIIGLGALGVRSYKAMKGGRA